MVSRSAVYFRIGAVYFMEHGDVNALLKKFHRHLIISSLFNLVLRVSTFSKNVFMQFTQLIK